MGVFYNKTEHLIKYVITAYAFEKISLEEDIEVKFITETAFKVAQSRRKNVCQHVCIS